MRGQRRLWEPCCKLSCPTHPVSVFPPQTHARLWPWREATLPGSNAHSCCVCFWNVGSVPKAEAWFTHQVLCGVHSRYRFRVGLQRMHSQQAGRSTEGQWGRLGDSATLAGPPVRHSFLHGGHSARCYPQGEPVSPSALGGQSLSLASLRSVPRPAPPGPWWAPKVFGKLLCGVEATARLKGKMLM